MKEFLTLLWDNLGFVLICTAIVAVIAFAAKLAEHFLPQPRQVSKTRRLCIIAICGAIATVLHIFDFPLPFLAPGFYKLDFSELPVMLCGFYLGPSAAVFCEALKILLKLLLKGTTTAFVGDFANFVVGCSLVLPATVIYHIKRKFPFALLGLAAGTFVITVFASAFNGIYLIPTFAKKLIPMENILAAGAAVNPSINSVWSLVLLSVTPLNFIKGVSISALTLLLYKKVARPLFGVGTK